MIFLWGILVVATVGMLMARVRTVSRQTATFLYTLIMTCAVCALIVLRAPLLDEHMVTQLRLLCAPQQQGDTHRSHAEAMGAAGEEDRHQNITEEGMFAVVSVVDGDTVKVQMDDRRETVRIIGINALESVDPRRAVECFGTEASKRATTLLSEKMVILERDKTQADRDRYNRLLRHVRLSDGRQFGEVMIAEGYAYEYTYGTAYAYQQQYRAAQQEAQMAQRGLWAPDVCAEH